MFYKDCGEYIYSEPELDPDFKNLSNEQKIDIFVFLPISDIFLNDIALIISEYYGNYIECDYCYEIANEICSKCDKNYVRYIIIIVIQIYTFLRQNVVIN